MIHEEFQDSGNSKDGEDELIIKPPQSSSELDSVLHHKDKKRRRHSKESESNKRHHHHHHHHHSYHHKSDYLKSSSGNHKSDYFKSPNENSSNRNRNKDSASFHCRGNKGKDQKRESENNLNDQGAVDVRYKSPIKYTTDRERHIKYDEMTDVRDVRLMKDIKENRRYSNKNKEKNEHFYEEMKVEWRKKRLQWLQNKKNADGAPWIDEKVSSEDESMNHEEFEKSGELLDQERVHKSGHEDGIEISHVSSADNDKVIISGEESEGIALTAENEKNVTHKGSLSTEQKESNINNPNGKPVEENVVPVILEETGLSVKLHDEHIPKRPVYCPAIQGCRSIDGFHFLNRIEEGTYGVVYRARDKVTKEIVALKRLKMEREKEGFPITSLREINTLLKAQHPNIVTVREIVVGSNMDKIYIVMDYVEHDLKSLMKTMPRPFLIGEVKTLLMQLLCAVEHLHDNWILHRDLKTSNLLLSHEGILKVGDFGLAREYGSPLKSYTPVVVTLWYRAPELLLGAKKYSTAIDMWSVGCVFGELLTKNALFPGKSESDQINRIFKDLGTPNENIWPGYSELPVVQSINITHYPYNNLKSRFSNTFTDLGFDLLNRLLTYNPARRISAEKAKSHAFFNEKPKPIPSNMFPTWPAKSEREYRTARSSPKPPLGGIHYSRQCK